MREQFCQHEWFVFSTAIEDGVLMVECAHCHRAGIVEEPSREEWAAAYTAPSHPYRWEQGERVRTLDNTPGPNVHLQRTRAGSVVPSDYWALLQRRAKGPAPDNN
jgi:hypothetical protein